MLRLTDDMIDEKAGVIVLRDGRIKTGVEQVSPLTGIVREVLKEIRAERGKVQSLTSRHVLTENGRPINKTMIENAMASTLKRAKIENFCFHDLRHCAKTSWARRVIPAEVAMKAAGHKSWQMHARYIHIQKTDVATVFDCSQGFPKESSTTEATAVSVDLQPGRRKVPGGAAGLQNQSGGRKVPGGFDSLPSPPDIPSLVMRSP